MVATLATNELIIRSIRSVRGVEASNRAYFAAEAGVEDGLYELSPHVAGYQTPPLDSVDQTQVRNATFDTQDRWKNRWAIESRSLNNEWSGQLFKDQKMVISLFQDQNYESGLGPNAINNVKKEVLPPQIEGLSPSPSDFSITFSISSEEWGYDKLYKMRIDSDQDGQLNEDGAGMGPGNFSDSCVKNPEDADCDGKVNEDSSSDTVILWKITDNLGRSLIPLPGCGGDLDAKTVGKEKSEICERDFYVVPGYLVATLNYGHYGLDESGNKVTIQKFISVASPDSRMQFEFLIVSPMEYVGSQGDRQSIPSINYKVTSSSIIPYPYFDIKSDGYFGAYKQSITTRITPKTSVPLYDFTIIQQQ